MLRIQLGYPTPSEEISVLSSQQRTHPLANTYQVASAQDLLAAQEAVREVYVADEVKKYIVDLVTATRQHPDVYLGSSPRGSLALFRTAQARAAMAGREYVIPDDVKALAEVTLAHRIIINPAARIKDITSRMVVMDVLSATPVPGAAARS
jgi:MoxR-like ATPase